MIFIDSLSIKLSTPPHPPSQPFVGFLAFFKVMRWVELKCSCCSAQCIHNLFVIFSGTDSSHTSRSCVSTGEPHCVPDHHASGLGPCYCHSEHHLLTLCEDWLIHSCSSNMWITRPTATISFWHLSHSVTSRAIVSPPLMSEPDITGQLWKCTFHL